MAIGVSTLSLFFLHWYKVKRTNRRIIIAKHMAAAIMTTTLDLLSFLSSACTSVELGELEIEPVDEDDSEGGPFAPLATSRGLPSILSFKLSGNLGNGG